jgi:hypothetical protein
MSLAGVGAADQHGVTLGGLEPAGCQFAHQRLVDRCGGEVEATDLVTALRALPSAGKRQLGDGHLVLDRARLLLGDLGAQQVANDPRCRVLALYRICDDVIIGLTHASELQVAPHLEDLVAFHTVSSGCRSGHSRHAARGAAAAHPA